MRPPLSFLLVIIAAMGMATALPSFGYAEIDYKAKQAIMLDYATGTVLLARNADEQMFPSSMTKMMTVYILFEKLKQGAIKLDDTLPVSEKAWRMGGSKMFVHVGDQVKVEDLMHGIIVQSGNDACVVVAEALGGSEEGFAAMMNEKAKALGMNNSHFMNATGWPDENHYTTARDLATLATHLIRDFPEYYNNFSVLDFTYNGIRQGNRNLLLYKNIGVDGLKTGHTEIAGYGITLSSKGADGRRLVLVINGLGSEKERASEGEILLGYGMREFETRTLVKAGQKISDFDVWLGDKDKVALTSAADVTLTLPRSATALHYVVSGQSPAMAPIAQGDTVATLRILSGDTILSEVPLVAAEGVEGAGFFKRIGLALHQLIGG